MMIILLVINTIVSAFASYFLKKASGSSLLDLLKNRFLYIGGALYVYVSLMTVWLLQKLPYMVVIPVGALAFVWTMLISRQFLGERISLQKIMGVALVIVGVLCVAL